MNLKEAKEKLNNPALKRLGEAKRGFQTDYGICGRYRFKLAGWKIKDGIKGILELKVMSFEPNEFTPAGARRAEGDIISMVENLIDNNGGDQRFNRALFSFLGQKPEDFDEFQVEDEGKTVLYTGPQAQTLWRSKILDEEKQPLIGLEAVCEFKLKVDADNPTKPDGTPNYKKYTQYYWTSVVTPELIDQIDRERAAMKLPPVREALA